MSAHSIRFGTCELDLVSGELRRGNHIVKLAPQPTRLLCLLASQHGEIVSRDAMRSHLWGDSEYVEYELGLNHCLKTIRSALRDDARKPRFIQTIPCRGYRFIAPLRSQDPGEPLGLAVLPFDNLNRDQELNYLADGLTEAIITELGQVPGLRVLSRQSVLHLRGTMQTLPAIAQELDTHGLVVGSVVHDRRRVRMNVQLMQAEPERELWAHAREADLSGALIVQREMARVVVRAVQDKMLA